MLGERRGELVDPLRADREARCGAVAAEALRRPEHASRPPWRSNAGIERPEPFHSCSLAGDQDDGRCSARPGARRRSRSRPRATPRRRGRSRGGAQRSGHSSTCAIAARTIASSTAWRSRFSCSSSSARRRAASASSVSSSSSAASGWPSRPAALIRGASRKPTAPASTAAGIDVRPAHQRAQPRLLRRGQPPQPLDCERPVLVDERDDVGDRRERDDVEVAREHAESSRAAPAELVHDAGAAELGERVVGRPRGNDGQSGSCSPGRWWSVTTTSRPSRFASCDLLHRGDPAVHRHHEPVALLGQPPSVSPARRSPRRNGWAGATRRRRRARAGRAARARWRRSRPRRSRRGRRSACPAAIAARIALAGLGHVPEQERVVARIAPSRKVRAASTSA